MKKHKIRPLQRVAKVATGMMSRLKSLIIWGSSAATAYWVGLTANWSKPTYQNLATKAGRNPYASRATGLISTSIASIAKNLKVFEPGPEGKPVEIEDHPLLTLLQSPKNEAGSISSLFEIMVLHLMYGGEVFMWNLGLMGARFEPSSISLIRPDRVIQVVRNSATLEIIQLKGVNQVGRSMIWPIEEVLFIKKYDPLNDDRGLPLLMPVLQALDLFDDQLEWAKSVSQHKGRIPGWFTYPDSLEKDEFKRLKAAAQEAYSRDSTQSRPGLLQGGMDFKEAGMNPKDAMLESTLLQTMRMISVGLGVDPALLGDNANKTYSNYVEAVRALIKLTSLPLLDWMLDWINNWYMPQYDTPTMSLGYNESDIKALREDATEKVARLVSQVGSSLISPDEAREELGRKVLGGMAKELLSKVGTIPLSSIGVGTVPLSEEDEAAAAALEEEIKQLLKLPVSTNGKY